MTFYRDPPMPFSLDIGANPRRRGQLFGIDRGTYLLWKANAGNAKARRRWRRKDIPNRQKASTGVEVTGADVGAWPDKATWAPGIWAETVSIASSGVAGGPTMRVAKVDREARTITLEALP
jgi:hypothetical protein